MTDPLAEFLSYAANIDRRTKSLAEPPLRNSFRPRPRKRSWTMSKQTMRENLLPAGAFVCSLAYVLGIVLFY